MNEKGFTSFGGILFCLILLSWGALFIKKKMYLMKENHSKMKILICSKNLNGAVKNYTSSINFSNKILKTLTLSKKAVNFIPAIGKLIGEVSIRVAINFMKAEQEFHYGRLVKNIEVGAKNGCNSFNYYNYITFKRKRNIFNELIPKGKYIKYRIRNKPWMITTKVNIQKAKTYSNLQKATLF